MPVLCRTALADTTSLRSGFDFVPVIGFSARLVRQHHTPTNAYKARNAHLANVGHVNTATELRVERGLEHDGA